MISTNESGSQAIQAKQYAFPYHYIPDPEHLYLSRTWGFGASYVAALRLIAERLKIVSRAKPDWSHLDLGCGDGALIYYLSSDPDLSAIQFSGVDINPDAVAWARLFNKYATFYNSGHEELTGIYNSISLVEVLEHIPPTQIASFLSNASRLIAPGGFLMLTVPTIEKPLEQKHYQHFSFTQLTALLEPYFCNIAVHGFERMSPVGRGLQRLRENSFFRLDCPWLNGFIVRQLVRLYREQSRCGRALVIAEKTSINA